MAEHDLETPLSPQQREQERRRREADEKQKEIEAREAQLIALHGKELERQAEIQGVQDRETQNAVAVEMAKTLAQSGARPKNFDLANYRGVIEEAVGKVLEAEALSRQQEHDKALALTAQQDAEREEQRVAAHEAAKREPIPGAIERFDGLLAASKEQAQQQRDAEAAGRSNPDIGTPLWEAQAATLDRQRRQFGRYDFPPNNAPRDGASAPVLPSPDPPNPPRPPTPARTNEPLTANEILARHNNPELEARFQKEQQVRADQKKAATPEAVVQNNAPSGKRHETGLMADFVTPETKRKVAEAEAARAANPSQSLGRGGGRGRG
jgi:hypothetical protein